MKETPTYVYTIITGLTRPQLYSSPLPTTPSLWLSFTLLPDSPRYVEPKCQRNYTKHVHYYGINDRPYFPVLQLYVYRFDHWAFYLHVPPPMNGCWRYLTILIYYFTVWSHADDHINTALGKSGITDYHKCTV